MYNLAVVLIKQGKYKEAESIHRQTLAWQGEVLGLNHPDTLRSMSNLAAVLHHQDRFDECLI
jgi:hypothetical protein